MATRPSGVKYWKGSNGGGAAQTVMTGMGNLYSVFLNWKGATDGDRVLIKDGTTVIEEIVINNADCDGLNIQMPTVGKQFATSLVVLVQAGGEVNISVGYDGNG